MSVTVPTIHLNGTGADTLKREYHEAYKAIDKAIEALGSATLNGRDYYVQGPDAYSQARQERDEAFQQLQKVKDYVEAMLVGIVDQTIR